MSAEQFSSNISCTKITTEYLIGDSQANSFRGENTIKLVMSSDYGYYLWPCSVVLAEYLYSIKLQLKDKYVLELGCGTGLPGMVAAMCGADVIFSDIQQDTILNNIQDVLSLNNSLFNKCPHVLGLTWGEMDDNLVRLPPQDIILGADLLYDETDFEDLIMTVAFVMEKNHGCTFVTSYQNRSETYMCDLLLLLSKWNLGLTQIPLEDFFPEHKRDLLQNKDIQLFVIQRMKI